MQTQYELRPLCKDILGETGKYSFNGEELINDQDLEATIEKLRSNCESLNLPYNSIFLKYLSIIMNKQPAQQILTINDESVQTIKLKDIAFRKDVHFNLDLSTKLDLDKVSFDQDVFFNIKNIKKTNDE